MAGNKRRCKASPAVNSKVVNNKALNNPAANKAVSNKPGNPVNPQQGAPDPSAPQAVAVGMP